MDIKLISAILVIALFSASAIAESPRKQDQNEVSTSADANVSVVIGKIDSARGKGGFANPHLILQVSTDAGNSATFYLMKDSIVTEVNDKQIDYMSNVKYGSKVEIKYSTVEGKNRVVSMHYLE